MPELTLPDGRSLDYTVVPGEGLPLLWNHGTPGSRTLQPGIVAACKERNVPLITYSRAGYGSSSRKKGRSVVDVVADLRALLDHLGYEKSFVGGWSGGCPHALACAARLRGCLGVTIVGPVAPYDAEGLDWLAGQGEENVEEAKVTLQGEEALQKHFGPQREEMLQADPEGLIKLWSTILPAVDKEAILKNRDLADFICAGNAEAFKKNSDGVVDDSLAFMDSWGFDFQEIKCPVFIYHGSEDLMCPFAHGKWIADHIPEKFVTKHLLEGQGHISIFVGKEAGILDELLKVEH